MPITLKILASLLLVAAVLWWMWRLPHKSDKFFPLAPALALASVWISLGALAVAIALWFVTSPDTWLPISFLILDPAALALGILVLWIYRGCAGLEPTIDNQCLQARTAVVITLIAVALGYLFVMTHKAPFTPIGP